MENNMKEESIHNLVKVLEQMENDLDFTVFYTWEEMQKSHHFCPAWDFDNYYYEIQYDNSDELQVLEFHQRDYFNEEGRILSEEEITQMTRDLVEMWADNTLKKEKGIKQMIESDGWQHFTKDDIITSEFNEDVIYSLRTEKLTKEEMIKRYNIKL